MRNLKKILALVLALMMVLSVMVTASAATYADDATIEHKEAVEVMSYIGVLAGTGDNFEPNGTLLREQAAKIVAYILNGGEIDKTVVAAIDNPFTDVAAGHWSEDSIKYCYNEGIILGVGDSKFDPKAELTGYQFAKMLLVAIGLCDNDDFVNVDWKVVTAATAKNNGLLDGLADVVLSAPLSREHAAQMAFNALTYAPVVASGYPILLAGEEYGIYYDSLIEAAAAVTVLNGGQGGVQSGAGSFSYGTEKVAVYGANLLWTNFYVSEGASRDVFGRPYVANWQDYYGNTIYAETATPVAEFNTRELGVNVFAEVGAAGTLSLDKTNRYITVHPYEDGVARDAMTISNIMYDYVPYFGNGIDVEIYATSTRNVYTLVAIREYIGTVTSVVPANPVTKTDRYINVAFDTNVYGAPLWASDSYTTEDFAKYDVVLCTVANGQIQSVKTPETVAGTISKVNQGTAAGEHDNVVTIGEKDYAVSQLTTAGTTLTLGATGAWYLDSCGNIIKNVAIEAEYNYLYVYATDYQTGTSFGNTYHNWSVFAILADGTTAILPLATTKITSAYETYYEAAWGVSLDANCIYLTGTDIKVHDGSSDVASLNGTVFSYEVDQYGNAYLASVSGAAWGMTVGNGYTSTASSASTTSTTLASRTLANDKTVYLVYNPYTGVVKSYTGTEIRNAYTDISGKVIGTAVDAGNIVANVVFVTGGTPTVAASSYAYVYVDASSARIDTLDVYGNPVYSYTAYDVTGAEVTVTSSSTTGIASGLYIPNVNNQISGAPVITSASASVVGELLSCSGYYNMSNAVVIDLTAAQTGMTTPTFKVCLVTGNGVTAPATDALIIYIVD